MMNVHPNHKVRGYKIRRSAWGIGDLLSPWALSLIFALTTHTTHGAFSAPKASQPAQAAPSDAKTSPKKETIDRSHWKAGVMEIKSDLETGLVEIGGRRVSVYPMPGPWTLSPGRYTLTLRDGRWNQTRMVQIKAGEVAIVKVYRDPANDPDAKTIPKDFEIIPDEPNIELYHPGAGFNLTTVGYILMGISAASLGYGVYEQVASNDAKLEAEGLPEAQASQKKSTMNSAMSGAWRSRVALGFGGVSLLSGVAFAMFGSGGWLDLLKVKTKTGPVFGPGASRDLRPEVPRWGFTVSDEASSLWAHWRW